jgi:Putative Ig domain
VAPFTWANTSPKLPTGLVLNASTGKITGTVKSTVLPNTYSVLVTIADSAHPTHHTWTKVLTITITH